MPKPRLWPMVGLKFNFYNSEHHSIEVSFYLQIGFVLGSHPVEKGLAEPGQTLLFPLLVSKELKLVLLNDGKGNFRIGGSYGDPKWPTRNAAVGDLNGDGYPDIAVANRQAASHICLNDGRLHFDCRALKDSPSAATVAIVDMNGDGANDVIYACRDSCQSVVYLNDGKSNFDRNIPWVKGA